MSDRIYPLSYKLSPRQTIKVFYLGFPETWKDALLKIAREHKPNFKDEYGLPTNTLKKLIESWMDGVISMAPLKKGSADEHWLMSCREYSEKDISVLCDLIKVWVKATYVADRKTTPVAKKLANDFCNEIKAKDIAALNSASELTLTYENGTVSDEAYSAIPLLVVNQLCGKEIVLNGQLLHLAYAGKDQLISQAITEPKKKHQYSFVFDFSVQTTPPERKALLLCHMSIRRWIPRCYMKDRVPYLTENINAHVKVSDDKYCQVPIMYDRNAKKLDWKSQDKDSYNIWGYEPLAPVEEVLMNPEAYADKVLLPYKNGMPGFVDSIIGTGVPMKDKAELHQYIADLLGNMICDHPFAERVKFPRNSKISIYGAPQEYDSCEDFRRWVKQCVETDQIVFEIYGLWKDPNQQSVLENVQKKIILDFGEDNEYSCLRVSCLCKEIGSFADAMPDDDTNSKIQKSDEIVRELGQTNAVTACVFILPAHENYEKGDPKVAIRNGFARTGRVVQFINPEGENNQHKIDNAVYDLYRQLGVVSLVDFGKKFPELANTPCVGMHVCTQVHGIGYNNKARFLPVYVTVNLLDGKTRVHCDVFSQRVVSYRQACIEMAQLFWKSDLEKLCVEASRSPAKQKLIELKNKFNSKDDKVLFIVQSDGNTRTLWSGISDKEIGGYIFGDDGCTKQINVGMPKNPYMLSLENSGVRIIRIRSNQEVPDYFTQLSKKATDDHLQYASVSGVFKYENVYWGINERPNDGQYIGSFSTSKIDKPQKRFAEKDMIELYPMQLQAGDDAEAWIAYANALRHVLIQYSQSTVLPLPLHLAKCLEEYLFDA